ncbi:MAG: substrate-binding domain-containing protein, partial [Propioniciclava sp.]
IGVLVPRLTDDVMALMFQAVERVARRRGFFAVVATCGDDPDDESRATETLLDRNVDGLVLATARLDDTLPASLRERRIPHALVLRTDGVSPSSLGEDETGGYLAVRHLLDLGHERIGVIGGPAFTSSGQERRRGAERALAEAGIPVAPELMYSVGYGIDDGALAAAELLALAEPPSAIFAANDNLAIGVQSAALARGLQIGKQLSVIGYNDIPLVSRLPVPLTSMHTNFDQIASSAFDLLDSSGETASITRAFPTLMPRASTGRP